MVGGVSASPARRSRSRGPSTVVEDIGRQRRARSKSRPRALYAPDSDVVRVNGSPYIYIYIYINTYILYIYLTVTFILINTRFVERTLTIYLFFYRNPSFLFTFAFDTFFTRIYVYLCFLVTLTSFFNFDIFFIRKFYLECICLLNLMHLTITFILIITLNSTDVDYTSFFTETRLFYLLLPSIYFLHVS